MIVWRVQSGSPPRFMPVRDRNISGVLLTSRFLVCRCQVRTTAMGLLTPKVIQECIRQFVGFQISCTLLPPGALHGDGPAKDIQECRKKFVCFLTSCNLLPPGALHSDGPADLHHTHGPSVLKTICDLHSAARCAPRRWACWGPRAASRHSPPPSWQVRSGNARAAAALDCMEAAWVAARVWYRPHDGRGRGGGEGLAELRCCALLAVLMQPRGGGRARRCA